MNRTLRDRLLSAAEGAALAAAGAGLAYAAHWANGSDLGVYGPALGALCAVGIDLVKKAAEHLRQGGGGPPPPPDDGGAAALPRAA